MKKKIEKYFKLKKFNTNIRIEIIAGITTFIAMAYILTVNPNSILLDGTADPRFGGVFIATAIGSFLGTLAMSLIGKMPFAQAPGMGLNTMIGTVIGGTLGFAFSYGNAMLMVFTSGIVFLLLSYLPGGYNRKEKRKVSLRERIFDGIPKAVRVGISVGLGLFITIIGLKNAGLINSNPYTLLELVSFNNPDMWSYGGQAWGAVITIFGLIVIAILEHYHVKGSIVIGIISASILAIPCGIADINILLGKVNGITWKFWENIGSYFGENGVFLSLFKEGFVFPEGSTMTTIMLILTFCMIDLFDTIGTVVGCASNAGLVNEDGRPLNYDKIMYADSLGPIVASISGTSSVTTFVESGAGIAAGGRTGLTSLTVAILFLISILIFPIFAFIPTQAAAAALIYVGVLMMKNIKEVDFTNIRYTIPSFLTIVMMPFTYSVTNGIGLGLISFVLINTIIYIIDLIKYKKGIIKEKPETEITLVTFIVMILFLIYFLVPSII